MDLIKPVKESESDVLKRVNFKSTNLSMEIGSKYALTLNRKINIRSPYEAHVKMAFVVTSLDGFEYQLCKSSHIFRLKAVPQTKHQHFEMRLRV